MGDFEDISKHLYDDFLREFGERKTRKIVALINNSRHTGSLLYQCRSRKLVPTAKDLGATVYSNLSMTFAKSSTVKFACFLLLDKWNHEVNREFNLASDQHLISIINGVRNHVH